MNTIDPLIKVLQQEQHLVCEALSTAEIAYVAARVAAVSNVLLVTADTARQTRLWANSRSLGCLDTLCLPESQAVFGDQAVYDAASCFERMALRQRLLSQDRPPMVVAHATALQMLWLPDSAFKEACLTLQVGNTLLRDVLIQHLLLCGYQPVNQIEDEGTFAVRGGVVDIFVVQQEHPVRLDFFGDELVSIHQFNRQTQRNMLTQQKLVLFPIRDVLYTNNTIAQSQKFIDNLLDHSNIPTQKLRELSEKINQRHYFFGIDALWPMFYATYTMPYKALVTKQTVVILDDPPSIAKALQKHREEAQKSYEHACDNHQPAVPVDAWIKPASDVMQALLVNPRIDCVALCLGTKKATPVHVQNFSFLRQQIETQKKISSKQHLLNPLLQLLRRLFDEQYTVFIACRSLGQAEEMREILLARGIDLPVVKQLPPLFWQLQNKSPCRQIVVAPLEGGFEDSLLQVAMVSDSDIWTPVALTPRRSRKKPAQQDLATLRKLAVGDCVIHQDYGIGRYLGLVRLVFNGVEGDYVHLEYAQGDKLYVPIFRLSLLNPYRGPTEQAKLDSLNSARWARTKQKVREAVLVLAHDLLTVQARRQTHKGFAMQAPNDAYQDFVATFPYEETVDQARAIADVLHDLTQDTPMDRLVCGDVGFGKTEVALRAAYLTVLSNYQVAVLVPTTVLAEQHGIRFAERLRPQGVVVEVLSRFSSRKQAADILQRVGCGQVDVLIGTHRLLSHDVAFQSLGLLVVDEEQRFGVKHKERLKKMRNHVHVLTLSATPIPRTLHMSMFGARGLSLIQTAPLQRSEIHTEVLLFDENIMQIALSRELHRGGQAFVVHNRVASIADIATLTQRLVPQARVAVAHGQMQAHELEKIMVDFVHRRLDILVCTAIVENGIDIPNANTMIVNQAENFGLSQLYQLRGRIGRSSQRAFAYLMVSPQESLSHEAAARLNVLKRFSELGAGYQIATHDLELRGAGDLLGQSQSGHIAAVGFELYSELLQEAMHLVRGQKNQPTVEPDLTIPVAAYLPEPYMPSPMQRLAFYQRMAQAQTDAIIFDIHTEIQELFGPSPCEVANLVEVMVIRRRLKMLGVASLVVKKLDDTSQMAVQITLHFLPDPPIDSMALLQHCQQQPKIFRMTPQGGLVMLRALPQAAEELAFLQDIRQSLVFMNNFIKSRVATKN